jgi:hypothetical protein
LVGQGPYQLFCPWKPHYMRFLSFFSTFWFMPLQLLEMLTSNLNSPWIQWGWSHVLDLALRYIEKPILLIKTLKIERTFKVFDNLWKQEDEMVFLHSISSKQICEIPKEKIDETSMKKLKDKWERHQKTIKTKGKLLGKNDILKCWMVWHLSFWHTLLF